MSETKTECTQHAFVLDLDRDTVVCIRCGGEAVEQDFWLSFLWPHLQVGKS